MLDLLVDNAESEEATKAKLKELRWLAEFAVHEKVDMHTARQEVSDNTLGSVPQGRARFFAKVFKGDEIMYDVCAPSSTGQIIDYLRVLPRGRGRRMLRGSTW